MAQQSTSEFNQVSLKKGIEQFGDQAHDAVEKEVLQLHELDVMYPIHPTYEDKKASLNYLMFIKKKQCGRVKARGCADGRKQRLYITKEESTAPTVMNESVMVTSIIDAKERRDVVTADVPGAFMQADVDDRIVVRFEGAMVDALLRIDYNKYNEFVIYEGGKKALYCVLNKALYGTLKASLLF